MQMRNISCHMFALCNVTCILILNLMNKYLILTECVYCVYVSIRKSEKRYASNGNCKQEKEN